MTILILGLAGFVPGGASANVVCPEPPPGTLSSNAENCIQAANTVVQKIQGIQSPGFLAATASALRSEGFSCLPPSPKTGLTCFGQLPTYPKPLSIVIPPRYQPTLKAETILFLHGNNLDRDSLEAQNARTGWGAMLADTGRNEILIAPLSYGKTEDFEKSLATEAGFQPFQQSVANLLNRVGLAQRPEVGEVTLTGHSGAYRPLSQIIKGGWLGDHIHEVALFDSAYGRGPEFTRFAAQKGHRFWSAYNPNDADLRGTNQEIMKALEDQGQAYLKSEKTQVDASAVKTNPVGFVTTNWDHYGAIPTYFRAFLKK